MTMRITVLGTGYLGATHAGAMAELHFEVLGVDVDPAKATALSAGKLPVHEPGLPERMHAHMGSGRLRWATPYAGTEVVGNEYFVGSVQPVANRHARTGDALRGRRRGLDYDGSYKEPRDRGQLQQPGRLRPLASRPPPPQVAAPAILGSLNLLRLLRPFTDAG